MLVGDHVIAGTMLLRLCMLPGLVLLIWAAPRVARHVGANGAAALWICVLNPLVIIHLMGGVHNEMLMVGLMMAGIALTFGRHPIAGQCADRRRGRGESHRGYLRFRSWCGCGCASFASSRGLSPLRAFAAATAASIAIFVAVFAVLSWLAGVGLGWLTALAGSVKIINWLTVPTAVANLDQRRRRAVLAGELLRRARGHPHHRHRHHRHLTSVAVVAVSAHRPRGADGYRVGDGDRGAVRARRAALVLHLAAGGRCRHWPRAGRRSRVIAGFSTWIMVIFKPDGSHGMYSWIHVLLATACAAVAWYSLLPRSSEPTP